MTNDPPKTVKEWLLGELRAGVLRGDRVPPTLVLVRGKSFSIMEANALGQDDDGGIRAGMRIAVRKAGIDSVLYASEQRIDGNAPCIAVLEVTAAAKKMAVYRLLMDGIERVMREDDGLAPEGEVTGLMTEWFGDPGLSKFNYTQRRKIEKFAEKMAAEFKSKRVSLSG